MSNQASRYRYKQASGKKYKLITEASTSDSNIKLCSKANESNAPLMSDASYCVEYRPGHSALYEKTRGADTGKDMRCIRGFGDICAANKKSAWCLLRKDIKGASATSVPVTATYQRFVMRLAGFVVTNSRLRLKPINQKRTRPRRRRRSATV